MKILNFGSLNIDRVYQVSHIVTPGETLTAANMNTFAGGKGLNQSIAAARAGAEVIHIGAIGPDGQFLIDLLDQAGVATKSIQRLQSGSGHAIIQVAQTGQNSIIVCGGANRLLTSDYITACLEMAQQGDCVLLQNETNEVDTIITQAAKRGLYVVFNPSPFPDDPQALPLNDVSMFIVNEIEGALLAGMAPSDNPDAILNSMCSKFPHADVVLTLGSRGVICKVGNTVEHQSSYRVKAIDTTAAGDTFCGYFLASRCINQSVAAGLKAASAAAAIAVSRTGAAPSIPVQAEVEKFLAENP